MAQLQQDKSTNDSALLSAIGVSGSVPTESEGLRGIREQALVKKGEAEAGTAEAKRQASMRREAGEAELYKKEREVTEPYREKYLEKMEDRPYPPPTKDNFKDFATMFSVISALTFAVGGKGRGSGMQAMAALNGAVDGYNKGNRDAFDRGMKEFDKKLAEYKTSLEGTREALRMVVDKEGLRTREGIARLKQAELNDQGVTASLLRENRIKDAINHVDNLIRKADAVEKQNQSLKDKVFMKQLVQGEQGGKIKMTTQPEARMSGSRESLSAINNIETLLKDKNVAKEFDSNQLFRTLLESPKEMYPMERIIRQSIFQSLPEKSKELFIQIAMARNDYFRQISGQAVTGSEGARNFFATLSPSDNSSSLITKANVLKPKFVRQLQEIVDGYQLPEPTERSIREQIKLNEIKEFANEDEFKKAEQAGDVIKGQTVIVGGRKATVR